MKQQCLNIAKQNILTSAEILKIYRVSDTESVGAMIHYAFGINNRGELVNMYSRWKQLQFEHSREHKYREHKHQKNHVMISYEINTSLKRSTLSQFIHSYDRYDRKNDRYDHT